MQLELKYDQELIKERGVGGGLEQIIFNAVNMRGS